jgi:hypothetical protein
MIRRHLKAQCRRQFDGSNELFAACWRQWLRDGQWTYANPSVKFIAKYLDDVASEKVNNSRSVFYLYG